MRSRDDLRDGEEKIEAFLTYLARDRQVAVSTQNQAMNALVFLYKHVLEQPLNGEINADRARRKVRIPVVLTREETARVIALMSGVHQLIVKLLYGSGLRITECLRLRVQDVDLEMKALTVRSGKGDKDRITTFPEKLVQPLKEHLVRVKVIHDLHPRPAARRPRSHEPTGRPRHRMLTPSHPLDHLQPSRIGTAMAHWSMARRVTRDVGHVKGRHASLVRPTDSGRREVAD